MPEPGDNTVEVIPTNTRTPRPRGYLEDCVVLCGHTDKTRREECGVSQNQSVCELVDTD